MRKILFLPILISLITISCHRIDLKSDYYIISKNDSFWTDHIEKYKANPNYGIAPPPDSPSFYFGYTDLVFIFDSIDWVYLCLPKTEVNTNSGWKNIEGYKYPNYVGFFPDDFISFRNEYFIDFIKDNDAIFQIDTSNITTSLFFIIASTEDTIKNRSFYDLVDLIENNTGEYGSRIRYMVRRTTEEENQVIFHKKHNLLYEPYKLNWSNNFINGKYRPFTTQYVEQLIWRLTRPRENYLKEGIKEKRTE